MGVIKSINSSHVESRNNADEFVFALKKLEILWLYRNLIVLELAQYQRVLSSRYISADVVSINKPEAFTADAETGASNTIVSTSLNVSTNTDSIETAHDRGAVLGL